VWTDTARCGDAAAMSALYPGVHVSEWSILNYDYDHYLNNNGTITDLHAQLRQIIRL
jgi:hypothetical protein